MTDAIRKQRSYYADTADAYDHLHHTEREHDLAVRYIAALATSVNATSVLDVGCGTGRGVSRLRDLGFAAIGAEPVTALLEQAVAGRSVPRAALVQASGDRLPFADASFDVVCALGVLHHVPTPEHLVAEMTRVARRAVFISDNNRFAHGSGVARIGKLVLSKIGLWPVAYWLRTRGKNYRESAEDGVYYSYSAFDSFADLHRWADRVIVVPTDDDIRPTWIHPLFSSFHVLVCALREK